MPSFSPLLLPASGGGEFVAQPLGNQGRAEGAPGPERPPGPEEIRERAYEEGKAAARSELPWQEAEELPLETAHQLHLSASVSLDAIVGSADARLRFRISDDCEFDACHPTPEVWLGAFDVFEPHGG